ncbi:MAG TPA: protein kinase [Urbifossiella sp.]|nr:protein kinase [Urbifossiella sp.]
MADDTLPPDRDARLERVLADYLHAAEAGAPPDRAALLAAHPDLADDLASFLRNRSAVERVAAPLRARPPLAETLDGSAASDATCPGAVIRYFGDYEIVGEIARGGMGVVYRARQVSLNRVVALKMILRGELATPADVQRFRAEAEVAAGLDHPGIVPIYEVGEHAGQHYFSMKLVEGGNLGEHVPGLLADPRAAARLVAAVARAVDHAHRHGLLHRDLKPANILVDAAGAPHVTDFGLAKRVEGDSQLTQSGAIVGTPSYMPPEQATGKKGLTVAADVYALGAILYELLTGRPPFRGESAIDTVLQVVERDAPRPRTLNPGADRDLETVAMKCLEKNPARRYASMAALADDLDRWLGGRPILARPAGPAERAAKWACRQPVLAGAAGAAAAAAVGLLVLGGFLWRNAELRAAAVQDLGAARSQLAAVDDDRKTAEDQRDEASKLAAEQRKLADEQAGLAKKQKDLADRIAAEVKRLGGEAATARAELHAAKSAAARTLYAADLQLAHAAWRAENGAGALELLRRHEQPAGPDPRGFEWHHLWRLTHQARLGWKVDPARGGVVLGLAIAPDGATVATAHSDHKIKLWSLADGKLLRTIDAGKANLAGLAFADDGRKLVATVRKPFDFNTIEQQIVGPATRREKLDIRLLEQGLETRTWVVAGDRPPVVAAFDPARVLAPVFPVLSGSVFVQHDGEAMVVMALAGSADGRFLALAGAAVDVPGGAPGKKNAGLRPGGLTGGKLIVWDVVNARIHGSQSAPGPITGIALSADGKRLAVGNSDGAVAVGEPDTKTPPRLFVGHRGMVYTLAFSADGTGLVSGAADGHVIAWDVAGGKEVGRFRGHALPVTRAVASADGRTLVSGGVDGSVKVWDTVQSANPRPLRGHPTVVAGLAFTADGRELVSLDRERTVRTWRAADGALLREFKSEAGNGMTSAIAPGGGTVAWGGATTAEIVVRQLATGKETRVTWKDRTPLTLALSPDGARLATGTLIGKSELAVWNTADGSLARTLDGLEEMPQGATFSPDGTLVATGQKGAVVVWDWKANTSRRLPLAEGALVSAVRFSPDGKRLAAATVSALAPAGSGVRVWDLEANRVVAEWSGAGQQVAHLAFSPDGRRLATAVISWGAATQQGLLKLWDADSGREVFAAELPSGGVTAVAFSPDGRRLAAATQAGDVAALLTGRKVPGDIYVWDATPPGSGGP